VTLTIRRLDALEVLDSRGNPTIAVEAVLSDGATAQAIVPSGKSTGTHEALELRDGDPAWYGGKGTRRAAWNVQEVLAPALSGFPAIGQAALDSRLIEIDGTPDKSRIGANAILGVSCAIARAVARSRGVPLWQSLAGDRRPMLPVPMVNILSGGHHAEHHFEFQDFLAICHGFSSYSEALHASVSIHRSTREVIAARGYLVTGVADEGGWGPVLPTNGMALEILTEAIERAGYRPAEQVSIAIDVAATHFFRPPLYELRSENRSLSSDEMIALLEQWAGRFPVVSIEDALAEDDWDGWRRLTGMLGRRLQLIGDDLFATNPQRLERGIETGVANAVLVKMNQIGTLTDTFAVIDRARAAGYRAVISARSGETEDDFLADLAVASGAGQIKVGSVRCSERLSKYNRLLWIERCGDLEWRPDALF
jgi:enolase